MPKTLLFFCLFICSSCLPLKIAPKVKTYKVVKTKRIVKGLSFRYGYLFFNPHSAEDFLHYVSDYIRQDKSFPENQPFLLDDEVYFLSFYVPVKETQTLHLLPILGDELLESRGWPALFYPLYKTEKHKDYVLITVHNAALEDGLDPNFKHRDRLIEALESWRKDYMNLPSSTEAAFQK